MMMMMMLVSAISYAVTNDDIYNKAIFIYNPELNYSELLTGEIPAYTNAPFSTSCLIAGTCVSDTETNSDVISFTGYPNNEIYVPNANKTYVVSYFQYVNSSSLYNEVSSPNDNGGTNSGFGIDVQGETLLVDFNFQDEDIDGGNNFVCSTSWDLTGQGISDSWNYYIITYASRDEITLELNNQVVSTNTGVCQADFVDFSDTLNIGSYEQSGTFMLGKLQGYSIFDSNLTQTEKDYIYNSGSGNLITTPVISTPETPTETTNQITGGAIYTLMSESGNGLGTFLSAITHPMGSFIFYIALIGAVMSLAVGVVYIVRKVFTKL